MTLTSVISMLTAPPHCLSRFRERPRPSAEGPEALGGERRARPFRGTRVLEQPEVTRSAPGERCEARALPQENGPNTARLRTQLGRFFERRLLEVILQEPVPPRSLQLPRYKVVDAITVLTGSQSSVQT